MRNAATCNGFMRKVNATALAVAFIVGTGVVVAKPSVMAGDDQVVASRGGANVTLAEIDARIMELPKQLRAEYLSSPVRVEETINGLLLEKQLAAKAGELGAYEDPYLALQVEQAKERFLAARARKLAEENIVVPDFTELAHEAYAANPQKYSTQETLDLSHVLITERGRTAEDALARANEVLRLAKSGERDFPSLVEEFTDEGRDKGKVSTGQLRRVQRGMLEPSFEVAAFALKNPGDLSEVVKTRYGYHVILLEGRAEAKRHAFADVEQKIIDDLRKSYIDKNKSALTEGLRALPIEANPDLVASLVTRYTTTGPKGERIDGTAAAAAAPTATDSKKAPAGSTPR